MVFLAKQIFSTDHKTLLTGLHSGRPWLMIQDLDGVCMALVRDPLTRRLERHYLEAAQKLEQNFYVLTNGEHIGSRGVNPIVERTLGDAEQARREGLYLPGLAAGGVQWQNRFGEVSHPGVSQAEIDFLAAVPERLRQALSGPLSEPPFGLSGDAIDAALAVTILDNPASPTVNINGFRPWFNDDWQRQRALQQLLQQLLAELQAEAAAAGLADSFFCHYAPNLGRGPEGERLMWASAGQPGTTDFQFMLQGAIKEVGVLVILNHYYAQTSGHYPLGPEFNARQAPRDQQQLMALARSAFDPQLMPRIIGVGDTVTSLATDANSGLRGGSDRGFLQLVQSLGEEFAMDNAVCLVDSSGGELDRPNIDPAWLADERRWQTLAGITDPNDPLTLNFIFTGGHREYVPFFCALAEPAKR
ncbi:glucosylglycerol 3-phosphatase [Halioxenophilus sp. WMMB6]|uniref:glucosylglycerol 3-phosphatase n=1 Tax=Halioxenophilus sp. WMMB6 TaxID=3073815 RepID=UPI00295ED402|nr:glucosylglycerol 3-phosphatase [Halioxenophilus sp. WMMB6]